MLNPEHFRRLVIVPALTPFPEHMRTEAAVELLLGTALVESQLTYLRQGLVSRSDGRGTALGLYQIEPRTHLDCWHSYLAYRPDLVRVIGEQQPDDTLICDLAYATRIARIIYWRSRLPLPEAHDIEGLARIWKTVYNTSQGAGAPEAFVSQYRHAVAIHARAEG